MTPAHFKARTKPFVILRIVFTAHPPPLSWPLQQKYFILPDYPKMMWQNQVPVLEAIRIFLIFAVKID